MGETQHCLSEFSFWISAHTERFDLSRITAFLVLFQWARSPSKAKRKQSSATFQSYVVHLLTGILLQIFFSSLTASAKFSLSTQLVKVQEVCFPLHIIHFKNQILKVRWYAWHEQQLETKQPPKYMNSSCKKLEFSVPYKLCVSSTSNSVSFSQLKATFGRIYVIGLRPAVLQVEFWLPPCLVSYCGRWSGCSNFDTHFGWVLIQTNKQFLTPSPNPVFVCWKHSSGAHKYLASSADQMTKGHKLNGLLMRRSWVT